MADGFLKQKPGFATLAIHTGHDPDRHDSAAAVVPPIFTSATFKQPTPEPANNPGFEYGRCGNPSRSTLEQCLAAIEGGKHALTFASGLGAITTLVSLLRNGDHVISSDDIYGGTNFLFRDVFEKMAIEVSFVDLTEIENLENSFRQNTKMIWLETPSNPCLKVLDIAAITKIANRKGNAIVVVDNTFLTPYLQRPLDFGADIVMYSLTKYMNGHSDVVMGAAVLNDDVLEKRLRILQISLGVVPSPFDCYLVTRSLKTLSLRMECHKKSSLVIAKWLENHPKVTEVFHPGLSSHPQYEITKKQSSGHSGIFSFKHCGGLKETRKLFSSLKLFVLSGSLGDCRSLVEVPISMSHRSIPPKQQAELGITENLIRISIGLEDVEDLIADLDQAFNATFV